MRIGVTSGMSGHYAVMYNRDGEAEQTGIGRYRTPAEAAIEALEWSESEGVPVEPGTRALAGLEER